MNDSESNAPATNNLINDDVVLRQLLKELPGVKTQFQFKGWQKSFLDRYHHLLNEEGVAKASAKYGEFQTLVLKLMKQILSLKAYYDLGEVRPERTSVKALSCIQELSKQIIAVTDEQVKMVPGTGQLEKEAGYTKFMMGVVLVNDDFKQHGRLVMCAESLARFHKKMSECINDRFILETMENFGWKLQLFCDIMSDLGLYQAMTKSQELVPLSEPLIEIVTEQDQKKDEQLLQKHTAETMLLMPPGLAETEADSSKSVDDEAMELPIEEEVQDDRQLTKALILNVDDAEAMLCAKTLPGKLSSPLKSDIAVASKPLPGRLLIQEHQPVPHPGLIESPRRRLRNLERFYPNKGAGKPATNPYPIKLVDNSEDESEYSQSSSSETVMTIQTEDVNYILGTGLSKDTPQEKDQSPSNSSNAKTGTKQQTSLSNLKRHGLNASRAKRTANPYQIQTDVDSEDESKYSQSSSSETVMTIQTEDAEHIFGKNQSGEISTEAEDRIESTSPLNKKKETGLRTSLSNFLSLTPESKKPRKSKRTSATAIDNSEYTDSAHEATPALSNAEMAPTETGSTDMSSQPQESILVRSDPTGMNQHLGDPQSNDGEHSSDDKSNKGIEDKETKKKKGRREIADQGSPASDNRERRHPENNDIKPDGNSTPVPKRKQKPEPLSPASASSQRDLSVPKKGNGKDDRNGNNIEKVPDRSGAEENNKLHEPIITHTQDSDRKSEDSPCSNRATSALNNLASPSQPSRKIKDVPDPPGDSQPTTAKARAKIPPPSPRLARRDKKDTAEKAKRTETTQTGQKKGGGDGEGKVLETVVVVIEDSYPSSVGGKQLNAHVLKCILACLSTRETILGEDVYKHNVHVVKSREEFGKADASTGFVAPVSAQGISKKNTSLGALIAKADCYIVVSPDQNHSIPLMGHFDKQCYRAKCAGIVTYSPNPWCEMRGAVAISMMCHDLGCLPVSSFCCIPNADKMLDEQKGLLEDSRRILEQLPQMLIQLEWTAVAFKKQRASVGVPF